MAVEIQQQFVDNIQQRLITDSAITLLVPPTKKLNDLSTFLVKEVSASSSIRSRSTRSAVQKNLSHIQELLKNCNKIPTNGIAIYAIDGTANAIEPIKRL